MAGDENATTCGDKFVPCDPVFPVRQHWWIQAVVDVHCHHRQLHLLLSCGTAIQEKSDGRDAEDTQNHGLYIG